MSFSKDDARSWRKEMWQIKGMLIGESDLLKYLQLGWEPFAVSKDGMQDRIWLKKNPLASPSIEAEEDVQEEEADTGRTPKQKTGNK
jgi:hypothetical protein